MPEHIDVSYTVYIEPFLGGGSVFLHLQDKFHFNISIINDIDSALINVYEIIRDAPIVLTENLNALQKEYNEASTEERMRLYQSHKERFKTETLSLFESAYNFIYLNQIENSDGDLEITRQENIEALSNIFYESNLICESYKMMLSMIDARTFVYLEPPHTNTASFDEEDRISIFNFLPEIKGKFVLIVKADALEKYDFSKWKIKKSGDYCLVHNI